jgi:type IV secretion system protein VirD4
MESLDQALTLLRSQNVRMIFLFQSIGQLHETFKGKEAVLLDNCEQIYFAINNYETADRVSKMLGQQTIMTEDAGENTNWSRQANPDRMETTSVSYTTSRNWKEHGRPLLMPDEVLRLSGEYVIGFLRDMPPILCRRVKWWELRTSNDLFSLHPLQCVRALVLAAIVALVAWAMMK